MRRAFWMVVFAAGAVAGFGSGAWSLSHGGDCAWHAQAAAQAD